MVSLRMEAVAWNAAVLSAMIAAMDSIHGSVGAELEVVALYVEGDSPVVTRAVELARSIGLIVALTAPDSMLAVGPREQIDIAMLRDRVSEISRTAHVAIGVSKATISGQLVDGPALDVEGWAPYPLPIGLWVADGL